MLTLDEMGARFQRLPGTSDVAQYFGCSEAQVRAYVKDGRLTAIRVGRSLRYTREALDAFIAGAKHAA